MGRFKIDFETLSANGDAQLVIIPEKSGEPLYHNFSQEATFKCSFNNAKVKRFYNAMILPERKFVRWRKKKMLVSKGRPYMVQMNTTFGLDNHVLQRLGL